METRNIHFKDTFTSRVKYRAQTLTHTLSLSLFQPHTLNAAQTISIHIYVRINVNTRRFTTTSFAFSSTSSSAPTKRRKINDAKKNMRNKNEIRTQTEFSSAAHSTRRLRHSERVMLFSWVSSLILTLILNRLNDDNRSIMNSVIREQCAMCTPAHSPITKWMDDTLCADLCLIKWYHEIHMNMFC